MKNSILALALILVSSATVLAQARFATFKVAPAPQSSIPQTNEMTVANGEAAELVSFPYYGSAWLDVIKDGTTLSFNNQTADSLAANKSLVIAGPAIFRIRTIYPGGPGLCTLKITPESFPPDKTLIIPDGTAGATVTLECSTNLINWSSTTNGFYSGTNSAKFFRIRAERAQ